MKPAEDGRNRTPREPLPRRIENIEHAPVRTTSADRQSPIPFDDQRQLVLEEVGPAASVLPGIEDAIPLGLRVGVPRFGEQKDARGDRRPG